jgi:hypothetical protein
MGQMDGMGGETKITKEKHESATKRERKEHSQLLRDSARTQEQKNK